MKAETKNFNSNNLIRGRDNLALTIMFPCDCDNNCKFCNSKKEYEVNPPNKDNVISTIKEFFRCDLSSMIKDVVITGGEPMQNLYTLSEILLHIPNDKNVYINTTFIKRNHKEFVFLVNSTPKIKAINISRHTESYENDCKLLNDILEDIYVSDIIKPVRINCVIGNNTKNIEKIVERWKDFPNVEISFRADYNEINKKKLHNIFCNVNLYLAERYQYLSHSQCKVCDTTTFITKNNKFVKYHKGLKSTLVKLSSNQYEVNDFVVSQNGILYVDWDFSIDKKIDFSKQNRILPFKFLPNEYYYRDGCGCNSNSNNNYCGGSGC